MHRRLLSLRRSHIIRLTLFLLIFCSLGIALLYITRAGTPATATEAENGARSGETRIIIDTRASGNTAVQFGQATNPTNQVELGFATGAETVSESDILFNQDFEMMKDMGAKWVRITFPWDVLQPERNRYNWARADRIRDKARELGLELIVTLNRLPNWASPAATNYGCSDQPVPNFVMEDYVAYARATVQRYKADIKVWELGNEPNHTKGMWDDPADPNACQYTKLMRMTYAAIKAEDSSSTVLSGGIGGIRDNAVDISGAVFIRQIYAENDNSSRNLFDGISYHPYSYPKRPSQDLPSPTGCPTGSRGWCFMVHDVRNAMIAAGDSNKKVWITEFGAPGIPNRSGTCSFVVDGLTPELQRDILIDVIQEAKKPGNIWIGPIMWFNHRDKGTTCPSTTDPTTKDNFFGLVEHNWAPGSSGSFREAKPGYNAFRSN